MLKTSIKKSDATGPKYKQTPTIDRVTMAERILCTVFENMLISQLVFNNINIFCSGS